MHHAHIDKFAYGDSAIHRLDARAKLLVTLGFTAVVLALPRTSPAVLSYYAIFPFALLVIGGIPLKFACKQVLLVSPFIVVLALSSAYYDRQDVTVTFGPLMWDTTVGWLRCATIVGKIHRDHAGPDRPGEYHTIRRHPGGDAKAGLCHRC